MAKAKEDIKKKEANKKKQLEAAQKLAKKVVQKQEAAQAENAKAGKDADCDESAKAGEKAAEQIKIAKKQADDSQNDFTAKIDQLSLELKECKDVACMVSKLKKKNFLKEQLRVTKESLKDQVKKVAKQTKATPEVEKKMLQQANGER